MMDGSLYTIVLEFKGGTYISQVRSASPSDTLREWAASLTEEDLKEWHLRRDELLPIIEEGSLAPLADRVNVWCLSGVGENNEQLLLNVVATVDYRQ
jgi:hypothetical protein